MPQKTHAQPVRGARKLLQTECVLDGQRLSASQMVQPKLTTEVLLTRTLDCPIHAEPVHLRIIWV